MAISKKEKWLIGGSVGIVIIIGLVSTLYMLFGVPNSHIGCIYINSKHQISLLSPLKEEKVYIYDFREGEDFSIFYYDKKAMKKIIKTNGFEEITENNKEKVNQILKRYQNALSEERRKLFDKTTSISELANVGGYYLYINNLDDFDDDYFICTIDSKMNKLYVFYVNH